VSLYSHGLGIGPITPKFCDGRHKVPLFCGLLSGTNLRASPLLRAAMSGATIYEQIMPRDGAIIFGDLTGKLDVLYVHCGDVGGD
jgi:hypothetical protein